jgi:hypothetical protein
VAVREAASVLADSGEELEALLDKSHHTHTHTHTHTHAHTRGEELEALLDK